MEKIIITEEQDKVIKHHLYNFADKQVHCLGLIERDTELDLVTIARIVSGESYEVTYEIKEKDLVLYGGVIFEFIKKDKGYVLSDGKYQAWRDASKPLTLICKAEDRHDLKEVSK